MIGSVSGYQYFPVDLALKANEMGLRDRGCHIGGIFGGVLPASTPRKRLFEACTYCLDNCTNYGDTLVDVPALGPAHLPGQRHQRQLPDVGGAEHGGGETAGKGP